MFISYAENFEDVILNRIFKQQKSGFYIDIGARHPWHASVTKAFYDRGWQGINIEPLKTCYHLLKQERKRDINLNFAIGKAESTLEFYELEGRTGLSTFDFQIASELANQKGCKILAYPVPVKKLVDVCQQYVNQSIDFLKIDVEGWEENVILGHDWQKFRPIVLLLEATIPNSPVRAETNIRQILESQNYEYVYFDGLNDYYLASEHSELRKHFQTPPNVFDKFTLSRLMRTQKLLEEAQIFCQQKEIELEILNNKYQDQLVEIRRLTKYIREKEQLHS